MLNDTDLKAKADAVVTAGNAIVALKASPTTTTLADALVAVQASRQASDELAAAVLEFSDQQNNEQIFNLQ